jgi:hypothetical protein
MTWGTQEEIDSFKAIILDMDQNELRFALLMVLNGADLPYAIDQAIAINRHLDC